MGGLDICFGRWDTPQHVLVDDYNTLDFESGEQIWHGKSTNFGGMCVVGFRIVHSRQGL
jgi:hypothetical protein